MDLTQEIGDLRARKPGQLRGPPGALHRARIHEVEVDRCEPRPKRCSLGLPVGSERQVGVACVAARLAPFRLAVAGEGKLEAQAGFALISGRAERTAAAGLSSTRPAPDPLPPPSAN